TAVENGWPFLATVHTSPFHFFSLTHAGAGVGKLITQWPEETLKRAGETLDISCYQNDSHQLAYMFWYQQPPGSGLKLVASTSLWLQKSYAEGYSEAKFEISRDNTELSVMTIKNVTRKDAATYFCAASDHTVSLGG
uniref:Ig-like domain-containing protein n=1 Tax=Cairina moschata TaxID=8855 RepID=A0A8C3C0V9_CAIMO